MIERCLLTHDGGCAGSMTIELETPTNPPPISDFPMGLKSGRGVLSARSNRVILIDCLDGRRFSYCPPFRFLSCFDMHIFELEPVCRPPGYLGNIPSDRASIKGPCGVRRTTLFLAGRCPANFSSAPNKNEVFNSVLLSRLPVFRMGSRPDRKSVV